MKRMADSARYRFLALGLLAFLVPGRAEGGSFFGSIASRPLSASSNDSGIRTGLSFGLSVMAGDSVAAVAKLADAPALDAGGMDSIWSLVGASPSGRTYYSRFAQKTVQVQNMDAKQPTDPYAPEFQEQWARIRDFRQALLAGTGFAIQKSVELNGKRFVELFNRGEFQKTGLQNVADNLVENQERLWGQANLPQALFNFGRLYQQAYAHLCGPLGRNPNSSTGEIIGEITNESLQLMRFIDDGLARWVLGLIDLPIGIGTVGAFESANFAGREDSRREVQIEAFCGSLVIQGWIVFETLCEDLWEAAVNFHPTTLAVLGGKTAVVFDDLQKYKFDVKSKMGTILKDRQEVSFRSLRDIQDTYESSFSEQGTTIREILNSHPIRYAAAVRNLLVHKRGIVDEEFGKQTHKIPAVPNIKIGEKFPITGALCAELTDSCRHSAIGLLLAVHAWIIGHPEKGGGA